MGVVKVDIYSFKTGEKISSGSFVRVPVEGELIQAGEKRDGKFHKVKYVVWVKPTVIHNHTPRLYVTEAFGGEWSK